MDRLLPLASRVHGLQPKWQCLSHSNIRPTLRLFFSRVLFEHHLSCWHGKALPHWPQNKCMNKGFSCFFSPLCSTNSPPEFHLTKCSFSVQMQEGRVLPKALFWRGGPRARDPGQKCWMLADEAVFSWPLSFSLALSPFPEISNTLFTRSFSLDVLNASCLYL